MKIFVDFDDVLFNSKKFKEEIKSVFENYGVSKQLFDEHYFNYSGAGGGYLGQTYNIDEHITKLKEFVVFDDLSVKLDVEKLTDMSPQFLFEDVINFLERYKGQELYLVSFGSSNLQWKKIKKSGIAPYFKEVIIADGLKSMAVQSILDSCPVDREGEADVFFIDDRTAYIDDIKQHCPTIVTILMRREEGRYKDEPTANCNHRVSNFSEVLDILG